MTKISLPQPVTVTKIIKENSHTRTFITDINLPAMPGQFVMIWLPRQAEKPFSLTTTHPFSFTVMTVGPFTKILNTALQSGDRIWYRGPFGRGTYTPVPGKTILVSGGCGCVPLYCLAQTLKSKTSTRVIIGAKTKTELLFVNRFRRLGLKTVITTDDGTAGLKGFTTNALEAILKTEKIACVYGCGPDPMLKTIADLCRAHHVRYQLSLEALMKCGFGICGSCSRKGKLVCLDVPVFTRWPDTL